jgi:hypothetical protein
MNALSVSNPLLRAFAGIAGILRIASATSRPAGESIRPT